MRTYPRFASKRSGGEAVVVGPYTESPIKALEALHTLLAKDIARRGDGMARHARTGSSK